MLRKLGSFLSKDGKEDGNVHSFDDLQTVFSPSTKGENRKRRTRDNHMLHPKLSLLLTLAGEYNEWKTNTLKSYNVIKA